MKNYLKDFEDDLKKIGKFTIAIYETDRTDFEIGLYLTSKMKLKHGNDIKPTREIICNCSWLEAHEIYENFKEKYNVVAKFQNGHLNIVCNKNNRRMLEGGR